MADSEAEIDNRNSTMVGLRLADTTQANDIMSNTSDMESENEDDEEIPPEKMDPEDREIYEKLKRQEQEERAEIERELKAHKEALARRQKFEELRIHAERLQQARIEREILHMNAARHAATLGGYHLASTVSAPPIFNFRPTTKPDLSPPLALTRDNSKPTDLSNSANGLYGHSSYLERSYPKSLSPPSPPPPTGLSDSNHHWSFQEQFKQLYELTEDSKRREFLDDLFAFMQKRGTPVNRIPIMAKQTLDLYELFRLVVSKGGLVEVINKKLWREITKGLNLPSSITSAAFTLRTQYMKYLYPYECDRLKLSTPSELQAAIDGNRREGRRSSFGYDIPSPGSTLIPPAHSVPPTHPMHHPSPMIHPHLNGAFMNGKLPTTAYFCEDNSLPPTPTSVRVTERDALAMEAASRAMDDATKKFESTRSHVDSPPPSKRPAYSDDERLLTHTGLPSAHLKVTSRNDGRSEYDTSLVLSMEINGIMYQGVLFAQSHRRL